MCVCLCVVYFVYKNKRLYISKSNRHWSSRFSISVEMHHCCIVVTTARNSIVLLWVFLFLIWMSHPITMFATTCAMCIWWMQNFVPYTNVRVSEDWKRWVTDMSVLETTMAYSERKIIHSQHSFFHTHTLVPCGAASLKWKVLHMLD